MNDQTCPDLAPDPSPSVAARPAGGERVGPNYLRLSRSRWRRRRREGGYTLVEMVATAAIASAVIGAGVPELGGLSTSTRLSAEASSFMADLRYARSEAVKRGRSVTLEARRGANWEYGWSVGAEGGRTLRVTDGLGRSDTLTGSAGVLRFTPTGNLALPHPVAFDLCPREGRQGRRITVMPVGRARVGDIECA